MGVGVDNHKRLELDLDILAFAFSGLEKVVLDERKHSSDQIGRKHLNLGVEIADIAVIEAAGGLDFIFSIRQFILQLSEVLAGFEFRIIFGNRKQRLERARKLVFGGFAFGDCRARFVVHGHSRSTRLGEFYERFTLMRHITFYRLHEIWDEVVAALELHVDVAICFVNMIFGSDKPIIGHNKPKSDDCHDSENNVQCGHISNIRRIKLLLEVFHYLSRKSSFERMITTILIFIAVLMVLVLTHEWGHFFTARRNGIKVHEFGFGFPPRLGGMLVLNKNADAPTDLPTRKYRFILGNAETTLFVPEEHYTVGTLYSLNLLPLGGFVKIKGENSIDEHANDPDSFAQKKTWQKALVLTAGVIMNVLTGWILISIGMAAGLPQDVGSLADVSHVTDRKIEILDVLPGRPAEIAGLKSGDVVRKVDKLENPRIKEMQNYVDKAQGKLVNLTIERDGAIIVKNVASVFNSSTGKSGFGIGILEVGTIRYPWHQALYKGLINTGLSIKAIFGGFGTLITNLFSGNGVGEAVSGPIGVAKMTGQVAKLGWIYLLQFTAVLSLNLAVLNILPIPALDGGRLLFVIIEKIIGRKVEPKYEQLAHTIGFAALMVLVVIVTARDIHLGTLLTTTWKKFF